MSRFALLFILMLLSACATKEPQPIDPSKYRFLFDIPRLSGGGCVAAYEGDSLLYIVSKNVHHKLTLTYVSIYDPKTGVFADVNLYYKGDAACRDIPFSSLAVLQPDAQLNFIESPEFRNIFDGYREDPERLRNAINAGPPYFRYDGKWQGQRSALNLVGYKVSEIKTIDDVARYLNNLEPKRAASMIQDRLSFINAALARVELMQQEAQRREEAWRQQVQRRQEAWNNRLMSKYTAGDMVCTYDTNLFGYVEEVQKERVKVHVVGRANPEPFDTKGFFFKFGDGSFNYSPIEAIRWLRRDEIAPCNFSGGKVAPGQ